ncbi:LLM class flavin-dependent oxidoreductase [Streptomyces sp. NPDC055092]
MGRLGGRSRRRLRGRTRLADARCRTPSTPPRPAVRRRDLAPPLQRSAQGHPVILQAGDSGEGRGFAARNADVIFSAHGNDFDDALAFAEDLRNRLRAVGRPDDDLRILPNTEILLDATEEEAQEKKRWILLQQVTPATVLGIAGLLWGIDLSDRDADGPLPKEDPVVAENDGSFGARRIAGLRAVVAEWRAKAKAHDWPLRETVIALGPQPGHVGTPSSLADKFAHFVRYGAVDGFNVTPYLTPDGLDDIVTCSSRNCRNAGSTAPSTPAPHSATASACANPSPTGPHPTGARRADRLGRASEQTGALFT